MKPEPQQGPHHPGAVRLPEHAFGRRADRMRQGLLALLAVAACIPATAAPAAQQLPSGHVAASLVSEYDSLIAGRTARVALRLVHEPQWHTYWIVPGDAGLPTRLNWKLPQGFRAGPVQWPVPQVLRVGDLANYGYEGTVLLPVDIAVPPSAVAGSRVRLAAHADWLVCKDVCIPEGADLTLELPVALPGRAAPGRFEQEFAAAAARIPQALALAQARATLDGTRIRLQFAPDRPLDRLQFFPLEPQRLQAAAPQPFRMASALATLDLQAAQPVAADFRVLRGVLVANGGPGSGDSGHAAGPGWAGVIDVPLTAGVIPAQSPQLQQSQSDASAPSPAETGADERSEAAAPSGASMSWLIALAGAFIGGLILNLMPCVFPVLSLKLLALIQHRHRDDPSLAAHGVAFAGGAIASFVLLACVLVALRAVGAQLGWGFQLQAPLVVALLTALFFGIGLNLLGTFEVSLGTALLNSTAVRGFDDHHLLGSFATGVLAVLVASPCTAPFMGAALGYAVTRSAPVALTVFAALGAGMAAPYLTLTLSPALLRRLPRPGAWMQRLRQLMAFPMFVTCVWLLWVLAQQIGTDALALVLAALVALGLAAWAAGEAQRGARGFGWVGIAAVMLAALTLVGATQRPALPPAHASTLPKDANGWSDWSPVALNRALARGPVLIDFTAAWCLTCKANEHLVLRSRDVAAALAQRRVTVLRADWTNRNDAIAHELARFGRSGVPLYVLYDGNGRPRVLPEILTSSEVLDALSKL